MSKRNLLAFFHFLARAPVTDFVDDDGLSRWRTPVPHPWFNGIRLQRPPRPRPADGARLDALIAPLADRPFTLWIDPGVDRALWQPLLIERGFAWDAGAPGMVRPLDTLPPRLDLPASLSIVRVRDEGALDLWCSTFVEGYELPPAWGPPLRALMRGLGIDLPIAHYLGLEQGVPVATSSLFYGAGVAGLMFVSTAPAARRRGLGAWLSLAPLLEARDLGYATAILQASEMGAGVYRGIGFRDTGGVDNYYRPQAATR